MQKRKRDDSGRKEGLERLCETIVTIVRLLVFNVNRFIAYRI